MHHFSVPCWCFSQICVPWASGTCLGPLWGKGPCLGPFKLNGSKTTGSCTPPFKSPESVANDTRCLEPFNLNGSNVTGSCTPPFKSLEGVRNDAFSVRFDYGFETWPRIEIWDLGSTAVALGWVGGGGGGGGGGGVGGLGYL